LVSKRLDSNLRKNLDGTGGDGTLHEVANGLAGQNVALGVVPSGTGNDFARSLGLSLEPGQAITELAQGEIKKLDLGRCEKKYFINMGGLGFDADVAYRVNRKRFFRGRLAYLIAALQTLLAYKTYQLEISIDNKVITADSILVSVGNGQYVGGGFRLLPQAALDDGLLDIMVVSNTSRKEIICALPSLYKGGHVGHPKCEFYRGREVIINLKDAKGAAIAQVDGEELLKFPLRFGIEPQALQVIVPKPCMAR